MARTVRFDLVLFDLDGTLADTADDIAGSMNHVLAAEGLAALPREVILRFVGHGVRRLIQRSFDALGVAVDGREEDLYAAFVEHYRAHMLDATRLFPGVAETLDRLPVRLAVVTNKPEAPARAILEGLGVLRRFGAVVGGDSLPVRKPDPGPLLHVAGRFGVVPARALMVGDTRTDLDAARAAGMRSCAARYGFAYQEDLSVADFGIDAFAELGPIVLG